MGMGRSSLYSVLCMFTCMYYTFLFLFLFFYYYFYSSFFLLLNVQINAHYYFLHPYFNINAPDNKRFMAEELS